MISTHDLRYFPHFAGAPESVLGEIAIISTLKRFKAGERLVEEGDRATHLMFIKSGRIELVYLLGDGRQVTVDALNSGDILCWSALLSPHRLTASAVAAEDGEVVAIDGQRLRELCDREAPLGYQIMEEVAKALRDRLSGLRVQIAAQK